MDTLLENNRIDWVPLSLTLVEYPKGDAIGKYLALISLTPFGIGAGFIALILFRRDLHTITFFLGTLANEALNNYLKHLYQEPRPVTRGNDYNEYGMPSSHAQFVWFFATYIIYFTFCRLHLLNRNEITKSIYKVTLALCTILLAIIVSVSRIYLQYHSISQVIYGSLVGGIFASMWFILTELVFTPMFPIIVNCANDKVTLALKSYLKKRNYSTDITPHAIGEAEIVREALVKSEVGRSHSILYTSVTSDHQDVDETFGKFVQWINELSSRKREHNDLQKLIPPLFCHFYIELLEKVHKDKQYPGKFFKAHKSTVETANKDEIISTLLEIWQEDGNDLTNIKGTFRENKYCVRLCPASVRALKTYLFEKSHVILIQLIHTWFNIREEECDSDESGSEMGEMESDTETALLRDVVEMLNITPPMVYATQLSNLKDDVTAGCIERRLGLAAYSYNNAIFITSLVTLKQLPNVREMGDIVIYQHADRIYNMQISFNRLITASNDCTVKLFDLCDYSLTATYTGHVYPVYCVAPTPNGALFVSGSYDHTCRLWSYDRTTTLRLYAGHKQEVTAVAFHPNSKYFVSGSGDRTIRMWSIEDTCPLRLFPGCEGSIYATAFSQDGRKLATAGDESTIRIWDIANGKQITSIPSHNTCITKLAWCMNDNLLCSATPNGHIQFWNMKDLSANDLLVASQQMPAKLLDLKLLGNTISCLTAQTGVSLVASTCHKA